MEELRKSKARVLITLGDQPLKHFVRPMGGEWSRLSQVEYGKLVPVVLDGLSLQLLPLAHPRQIDGLGSHSPKWRNEHERWEDAVRKGEKVRLRRWR